MRAEVYRRGGGGGELGKEWKRGKRRRWRRRRIARQRDEESERREGSKRGKRGLGKEGGARKKGRAVAKRVDRAIPRNGRAAKDAKRRVAGGEDR